MTAQPARISAIEAATQAAVGIPLGLVVVYVVALLGLPPAATAALTTAVMFLVSTLRGYWIRRRFDRRQAMRNYGETMEYVFKREHLK